MSTTLAEFHARLEALAGKFKANAAEYLSTEYSEAQARRHFIDPLFDALGWDLEDNAGLGPARCEVWMEKGETTGKPDYNFRINARTKFFAEAKAPHVKLSGPHILQAKRYAWNHADVSFAVLTDFEEFRLYDATLKPDPEHPDLGLIFQYRYDEYLTDAALADLWQLSRDEVAAGSLDKLLKQDAASRRMRVPVDKAFLADLTDWREQLAKDAFRHNSDLDVRALNEAVQVMLDRLIFCRIAEDRRIVQADTLKKLVERWSEGKHRSLRATLNALFETVNEDLNGEVFKPNAALDEAAFDDALTARIIHGLTDGPYDFAVIGVELLGSIYERYLGKTIRVTAKRAIVEDKPEVRKAGGVYYTPRYIVDYIVEQTVGQLIEGKTPAQIARLRIADPACGSGSFLLAAYQKLMDYHVAYYSEHPQEARQDQLWADLIDADPVGGLPAGKRLSILKKGEILTNNIFGVDLDPQAVEITMMSLYIKALEGETTLPHKHGLLPTLANNIKCGNSLIGTDYFEGQLMPDAEEWARVKPFDWESEFPQVFNRQDTKGAKGFDCVIGNPPYVRQESLSQLKEYFKQHYEAFDGVADLYVYFIEQGTKLLRNGGLLSIIVSSSFLRATYGASLRHLLRDKVAILRLVDFGGLAVFQDAKDTYVCIPLLGKRPQPDHIEVCKVASLDSINLVEYVPEHQYNIPASRLTSEAWLLDDESRIRVFQKIMACGIGLGQYVDRRIFYGVKTGLNEAFVIDTATKKKLITRDRKSAEIIKPLLQGEDIRRWRIEYKERWIIFTRRGIDIDAYPAIKAHLTQWKEDLTPKQKSNQKRGRKPGSYKWYEIQDDVAYYAIFESPKIIFPDIAKGPRFYFDTSGYYLANTAYALGTNDLYLLGVLNSKLFWFAIGNISIPFGTRAGQYRYRMIYQYMEKVPIRPINFSDPADVARHDRLVSLVERMLELHKRLASARASADHEMYQRQVEATDRQIDALVYELYGLTEEEIKIVEAA